MHAFILGLSCSGMGLLASDMQIPMEEDGSRGVVRGFRRLVDLVIVPVLCGPLLHSGASVDQCFLGVLVLLSGRYLLKHGSD